MGTDTLPKGVRYVLVDLHTDTPSKGVSCVWLIFTLTLYPIDTLPKGVKCVWSIFTPTLSLVELGPVAYRLALTLELANVHDVFHVSMLRKYVADPTHMLE